MDVSVYMKIEGHKSSNPRTDPAHRGWIPLYGATLGHSKAGLLTQSAGPSREPGRVGVRALRVDKELDSSTTFLYQACAAGKVFGEVLVDYCESRDGKVLRRQMRLTLQKVQIVRSRPQRSGTGKTMGEEHVLDAVSLKYQYNM